MKLAKRGLLCIFILLLIINTVYAVSLSLSLTNDKVGPNSPFEGYLDFNFTGFMPLDSLMLFNVEGSSQNLTLENILASTNILSDPDVELKEPTFETIVGGGEELEIYFNSPGTKIESGIDISGPSRQPYDVTIEEVSFVIEPYSGTPNDVILSIGNKNVYRHKSGSPIGWNPLEKPYLRDFNSDGSMDIRGGDVVCQLVNISESASYTIKSQIKREAGSESIGLNATISDIPAIPETCSNVNNCCIMESVTTSFGEKSCIINKNIPERKEQYVCLYPTGGEVGVRYFSIKTENVNDVEDILSTVNGVEAEANFYIYGDYAIYNRNLISATSINLSAQYIQEYIFGETGCADNCLLIPINISTQSSGGIRLKDLNLEYTTNVGSYTHNNFEKINYVPESVKYEDNIHADLSNLNVYSPNALGEDYELFVNFDGVNSNQIEFDVVPAPTAIIRYGPFNPGFGETVNFDGSRSISVEGRSIVSYLWFFGDGTNATGMNVSQAYLTSGNYIVKLKVTDSEGISGLTTLTVRVKNESSVSVDELINSTLDKISEFERQLSSSQQHVKNTADLLKIPDNLNDLRNRLNNLLLNYNSVATSNISNQSGVMIANIRTEVDEIASHIPTRLIVDSYSFSSKISGINQLPSCCGFDTEELKIKLLAAQKDAGVNGEARVVTLSYLDGSPENFMIIKKDIVGTGINIFEFVPFGFVIRESLNEVNFSIPAPNVFKFSTTNQLVYRVDNVDLAKALQTKTAVFPSNLASIEAETIKEITQESLCGNNICEFDEDENVCPQDCKPSNVGLYVLLTISILLILVIVYFSLFFKGGLLKRFLKPKYNASLFKTEKDYVSLKNFVDNAMRKGIEENKIKITLKSKGWSDKQINGVIENINAVKKASSEKSKQTKFKA